MIAAIGIVITHAPTMLVANPQRTALRRLILPTPTMAPAMACVVETGRPRWVANRTAPAAPVSAQNPLRGLSRVRRAPIVRTMRQPPLKVPIAIAVYDASSTHLGMSNDGIKCDVNNTPVINPAVFCASLEPCER